MAASVATVAGYGRAFGMRVLVWSREKTREDARRDGHEVAPDKLTFFRECDVLSLHMRAGGCDPRHRHPGGSRGDEANGDPGEHQPRAPDRAGRARRRAPGRAPGHGGHRCVRKGTGARHRSSAAQHAERHRNTAYRLRLARTNTRCSSATSSTRLSTTPPARRAMSSIQRFSRPHGVEFGYPADGTVSGFAVPRPIMVASNCSAAFRASSTSQEPSHLHAFHKSEDQAGSLLVVRVIAECGARTPGKACG